MPIPIFETSIPSLDLELENTPSVEHGHKGFRHKPSDKLDSVKKSKK